MRAQAGQVQTVPRRLCSTIQVKAAAGTGVPHSWQAPGEALVPSGSHATFTGPA